MRVYRDNTKGADELPSVRRTMQMQKYLLGPFAGSDTAFEYRFHPDGTTTRHVKRDIVRSALEAISKKPTR